MPDGSRRHRRRRVAAYVGAAALATALVGLGGAQSALALTEFRAYITKAGDHSARAGCPSNMHLVSGGGKTGVIPANLRQTALSSSHKSGNGWVVAGYSFHDQQTSPSHNFRVTAYAYCARHNLRLRTFKDRSTGTPRVTTGVECDSGHLVSGGGSVTSPFGVPFLDAKRGNGWKLGADATSDGGPSASTTTQAAAYCTPKPYRLRTAKASGTVKAHDTVTKTAHCPEGTRVISGGASAGDSPSAVIWYSRKQRNGWRISVTTRASPTSMTAYAYCH
jgi:hypothetical protein